MTLGRWSPMREFDRLFVDFFGTPLVDYSREPRTWYLPLDVVDRGNAYEVKAALPGFKAEDVELTFADGVLAIKAQRKQESESKDGSYLRRELTYGDYERRGQVPGDGKGAGNKAALHKRVLAIPNPTGPPPPPGKNPAAAQTQKKPVRAPPPKKE